MLSLRTLFWIISNIAATVAIVLINKHIYTDHGFAFGNLLITFHLLVTAILAVALERTGVIVKKGIPLRDAWQLAVSNWLSVMFVNLSLLHNSVGMYQILKLANIPVLCLVEWLFLKKTYSPQILASLAVLLGGISVCTVTDLTFNWAGFTFGIVATLGTSWNQIQASLVQNRLDVRGAQIMYWTAGPTAALFATTIGITDDTDAISTYVLTSDALWWILASCCIAVWIHISSLQVIGRASPLTFQVAGHLKTVLVFVFAFVVLKEASGWKNLAGILVACCGMVWYSYLKSRPSLPVSSSEQKASLSPSHSHAARRDDDEEKASLRTG